ncbi:MAG TPA: hypothetical protein VIH90_07620 [Candidatus Saccharimonadales bacterium]
MSARISPERIKELQKLLKAQTGKDYSDEEAQEAGLAIIRFVIAKESRKMATGQKPKDIK